MKTGERKLKAFFAALYVFTMLTFLVIVFTDINAVEFTKALGIALSSISGVFFIANVGEHFAQKGKNELVKIFYIIACALLLSNVFQFCNKPEPEIKKIVTQDTVYIEKKIDAVKPAKMEAKTDTVKQKVNIDSIYQTAKSYWKRKLTAEHKDTASYTDYIAEVDTTLKDIYSELACRFSQQHAS